MAAIIVGVDVSKPNPQKIKKEIANKRITSGVVGIDVTAKPTKGKNK